MKNIVPMLRYALLILKHKWFVLIAGLKIGCPLWRLIAHDLSKFSPSELPHYARRFYGSADDPEGWERCWAHHLRNNDHHWEHWVFDIVCTRQMPEGAWREMVADWLAASRAYEGAWPDYPYHWKWLSDNWTEIMLHDITRSRVAAELRRRFQHNG